MISCNTHHMPDIVESSDTLAKVIFITGFLGAGKTTLLTELARSREDMSDTVILLNEFGDVSIDGLIVGEGKTPVIELNSGCVCCTLLSDLTKSISKAVARFHPQWIVVETSGLADPYNLFAALNQETIRKQAKLQGVITVLDAECWPMRDLFGHVFASQLKTADLIILNKKDLLDRETLGSYLLEISGTTPNTSVVPAVNCRVDCSLIWGNQPLKYIHGHTDTALFEQDSQKAICQPPGSAKIAPDEQSDGNKYSTITFSTPRDMDENRLNDLLAMLPFGVYRVKGVVRLSKGSLLLNWVRGRSTWSPWKGESDTSLVIVGWDFDPRQIHSQLQDCIVKTRRL